MSNIFDEVQRGSIYHGELHLKKVPKKTVRALEHKAHEKIEQVGVVPYYEGGMNLETYGHSKWRGFGRAVARKTPQVTREIVSSAKRTITPAMKSAGKAMLKAGLSMGKVQFEQLKKRRARGENIYW